MFRCFLKPFTMFVRRVINFHKFSTWICSADRKLNLINSKRKGSVTLREIVHRIYINHQTKRARDDSEEGKQMTRQIYDVETLLNLFTRLLPHKISSRLHQSSVIKLNYFGHVRWFEYCDYVIVELWFYTLDVDVLVSQLHQAGDDKVWHVMFQYDVNSLQINQINYEVCCLHFTFLNGQCKANFKLSSKWIISEWKKTLEFINVLISQKSIVRSARIFSVFKSLANNWIWKHINRKLLFLTRNTHVKSRDILVNLNSGFRHEIDRISLCALIVDWHVDG